MDRISAIERLNEEYLTETELAKFLNVDPKRIRDLRSHHVQGKQEFISHIKPSSRCILYKYSDVIAWLDAADVCSFGINKCDEREETND